MIVSFIIGLSLLATINQRANQTERFELAHQRESSFKMKESIEEVEFLLPRQTYDEFIIGLCMRTLRVIYDAEKIIHLAIMPSLENIDEFSKSCNLVLMQDAIDDFNYNFLFEPEHKSKFIYSFPSSLNLALKE